MSNALANPTLELHDSNGDVVASNDDWMQSDEAIIRDTGLAPSFDEESVILATLGPGAFTAILRGLDESSGVGLFEVYKLALRRFQVCSLRKERPPVVPPVVVDDREPTRTKRWVTGPPRFPAGSTESCPTEAAGRPAPAR